MPPQQSYTLWKTDGNSHSVLQWRNDTIECATESNAAAAELHPLENRWKLTQCSTMAKRHNRMRYREQCRRSRATPFGKQMETHTVFYNGETTQSNALQRAMPPQQSYTLWKTDGNSHSVLQW